MVTASFGAEVAASPWAEYFSQSFYHTAILPLLVLTIALAWLARPSTSEEIPAGFRSFQVRYLCGWCLCVAADWLQGPYVYALYSAFGFNKHEIAQLFVAGFGASLVCGCFVGSLADKFGRKSSALAYCLMYVVSCLTKHCNLYWVLMIGRIAGGIATSLLFSCFECWMVSEHMGRHGFSSELLSYMFGLMYTLMYVVAIISGLFAQSAADQFQFRPVSEGSVFYVGGATAPFDLAIVCLVAGAMFICCCWGENYGSEGSTAGEGGANRGVFQVLSDAGKLMVKDRRLWLLGVVVACFEGSMFAFVFNWTPALESEAIPPPLGLIFSLFMMSCMCGASMGTIAGSFVRPAVRLQVVCVVGVCAFFVLTFAAGQHLRLCFFAFLLFECAVGVYFPTVGVLKSEVVPENVRGTMYNLYRVPLNAVVVCLLLTNMSLLRCYGLCASLILFALVAIAAIERSPTGKGPILAGPGKREL